MLRCFRRPAAWASRTKRAFNSGRSDSRDDTVLRATRRWKMGSSASYTVPMLPRPMTLRTWYLPILSTFRARIVRSCYRRPEDDVVVGLGVDLVELGRVAKALDRWGSRLVGKLMDADEAGRVPFDAGARGPGPPPAPSGKEGARTGAG